MGSQMWYHKMCDYAAFNYLIRILRADAMITWAPPVETLLTSMTGSRAGSSLCGLGLTKRLSACSHVSSACDSKDFLPVGGQRPESVVADTTYKDGRWYFLIWCCCSLIHGATFKVNLYEDVCWIKVYRVTAVGEEESFFYLPKPGWFRKENQRDIYIYICLIYKEWTSNK